MEAEERNLILDELRAIRHTTGETQIHVARQDERLDNMEEILKRLDAAIYGNGKPGLRADVQAHASRLAALEGTQAERKAERKEQRKFKYGLYATAFAALLNFVISLFK